MGDILDSYDNQIDIISSFLYPPCIDDIEEQTLSPLSCLREFESKWTIEFDLPLVLKEDINVSIDTNNVISVEAKLKETYIDPNLDYKNEFHYFKKGISLPGKIDEKNVTAHFTNGRLVITIPKSFRGTKIKVE
jgi:HSP20 family protein